MSKKWYSIKMMADNKTAEVYIYDYIGEWGVSARSFINELKDIDAKQIDLHINSPGGEVIAGIAIQNLLKQHDANVTTYIDGMAGSIASIIALAGDQIFIADNGYVMIHNPASVVVGEAKDMLKEAEVLNKMAEGAAQDYAERMGISVDDARSLMDEETWYLGQEAVDAGYADSTYEGSKAAASFDSSRFSDKAPQAVIDRFTQNTSPPGDISKTFSNHEDETVSECTSEITETEAVTDDAQVTDEAQAESAETDASSPTASTVDVAKAVQEALEAERKRTAELNSIGDKFGFKSDAKQFVAEGKSIEDFRAHILAKSPEAWKASLSIQNPSVQESESDDEGSNAASEAIAKIKERREKKFN